MTRSFQDDLRRFGPDAAYSLTVEQARAYCAELTATHYENFSVVTWLTPRDLRPAFQSIYAFCRWSDDLGDEVGDRARSLELLTWWRGELAALYNGRARHPVMLALTDTIATYGIPIEPFQALISAFEQDQVLVHYETYEQLLDYCTRSANPVGQLVLYLARAYNDENARLSDATCTGLQLANFWQDVARDHDIGRIYLPREDRERFGVTEADIRDRRFSPAFAELLKFEIDRTRFLLDEGRALVPRMPGKLAVDVDLFSRGGLAILDLIEKQGYDVLTSRPKLSKWQKIRLLLGSVLSGAAIADAACADPRGGRARRRAMSDRLPSDLARSYAFCTDVARREAKNFYPSFLLLPADRRRAMCALYAFMRQSDDIADEPGDAPGKRRAIDAWRCDLDAALDGRPGAWPGWPALVDTVAARGVPRRHLLEVVDGVEMDVEPQPFATFDELYRYCYLVASAVGLCCLHVWGFTSDGGRAEALAESYGLALQLTNIVRDVGEDARNGRVYLPQDELATFGVDPADLAMGETSEPLRRLLEFQARRAANYYAEARPLAPLVDPVGRPVLDTIVNIYHALLDEIVRRDYEVLAARVRVPAWRKGWIAARAFAGRFAPRRARGVEAPPAR